MLYEVITLSVGRILYRQVAIYNLLCFSLLIIFLVDPLAIYNAGLWLSHLAVLTIRNNFV